MKKTTKIFIGLFLIVAIGFAAYGVMVNKGIFQGIIRFQKPNTNIGEMVKPPSKKKKTIPNLKNIPTTVPPTTDYSTTYESGTVGGVSCTDLSNERFRTRDWENENIDEKKRANIDHCRENFPEIWTYRPTQAACNEIAECILTSQCRNTTLNPESQTFSPKKYRDYLACQYYYLLPGQNRGGQGSVPPKTSR